MSPTHIHADRPTWGAIVAMIAIAALISFGLYQTENPVSRWIGLAFFVGVGAVLIFGSLQSRGEDRRLRELLDGRPPLTVAEFADLFRDVPHGQEAAHAVRELLEEHMKRDLAGLRPDDPLTEFRDWLDPIYFDELAMRLDFQPPENYPDYAELVTPLQTVRDLVAAVARKLPPS